MSDIIYRIDERDNISIMLAESKYIAEHTAVLYTVKHEGVYIIRIGGSVEIPDCKWLTYREFMESARCPASFKALLPIIISEERYLHVNISKPLELLQRS
jgi:hypothetical protein